ncbi:MAG: SMI1/KNR4 family protein [Methylocystis sp.]
MAAEATIWSIPAYLPYVHPPLTEAAIKGAELRLGVRLPSSYLEILKQQNGGYVRFSLPNMSSEMVWGIGPQFPSITDQFDWRDPEEASDYDWSPRDAHLLVPFDGDGHWHLCLDYRAAGPNSEPKVTYVDLEGGQEEPVAGDFATFLKSLLFDSPNATFGVGAAVENVLAALESELGVHFQSQGALDHGYEMKRVGLGADRRAPWIWVSENEVARGFVRPSDPRYEELNGLLKGTALRFPEYPQSATIVECNVAASPAVMDACARRSLPLEVIGEGNRS